MTAIQLHGGMGMTDECRVGHYAKRLMVIGQMFGDTAWQLEQLAASSND
jgi:pimeloyl-CoA dehydrogenase